MHFFSTEFFTRGKGSEGLIYDKEKEGQCETKKIELASNPNWPRRRERDSLDQWEDAKPAATC
jgi:hypothetical protein